MVAVDVEELAARAVKAVEGRLIGIGGGAAGTQEGSRCADVGGRGGGVKGAYEGKWCIRRGSGSSTGRRKQATRALEHGVLGPDDTGLESSLVETADEGIRPALLDETTRGAGSDGSAAGGGWGAELNPIIPTLSQITVQSVGSP